MACGSSQVDVVPYLLPSLVDLGEPIFQIEIVEVLRGTTFVGVELLDRVWRFLVVESSLFAIFCCDDQRSASVVVFVCIPRVFRRGRNLVVGCGVVARRPDRTDVFRRKSFSSNHMQVSCRHSPSAQENLRVTFTSRYTHDCQSNHVHYSPNLTSTSSRAHNLISSLQLHITTDSTTSVLAVQRYHRRCQNTGGSSHRKRKKIRAEQFPLVQQTSSTHSRPQPQIAVEGHGDNPPSSLPI